MFRRHALPVAGLSVLLSCSSVFAAGIGDLVNFGLQVGSKLGGAAIDKVKDSMRDPAEEAAKKQEEERKVAEAYQKAQMAIETKSGLSPLERERQSITLARQYEQVQAFRRLQEESEARQRARRDQLFTTAGLIGVAAEAAATSPSIAMKQAEAMAKAGVHRDQTRDVMDRAEADARAGKHKASTREALDRAGVIAAAGTHKAQTREALTQADSMTKAGVPQELARETMAQVGGIPHDGQPSPKADDAFSPDLGRRLYVEFVGAPNLTKQIRNILSGRGHVLVEQPEQADVRYRIEGEFVVPETRQYAPLTASAGELLENPRQINLPERKLSGDVQMNISRVIGFFGELQGKKVPDGAQPREQMTHKQEVLLVIARQPTNAQETRFSVIKSMEAENISAQQLAQEALSELLDRVGLPTLGA